MPSFPYPNIAFGTSGLRGFADGFSRVKIYTYIGAFLRTISLNDDRILYVGADLRSSSPRIAANVIEAANANGWKTIYAGNVPTPALAAYAMAQKCPAIMVTGSHTPKKYNGIKFYYRDKELLKGDEEPIQKHADLLLASLSLDSKLAPTPLPKAENDIANSYIKRFISAFSCDALYGLRLGIDMHSAVSRDILVQIMQELGATCFPFRRSEEFIAIDTEAISKDDIKNVRAQIKLHNLDAVISTDGDGDRPVLYDENSMQVNGDVLGALSAKALGANTIVTPITSSSAIEKSGWFNKIIRTKIGSPYVIHAMMQEQNKLGEIIVGFEANGGFLLGSDINLMNGTLSKLITRDAVLPLIAVLAKSIDKNISISKLVKTLPKRFMKANKIKNVTNEVAKDFLGEVKNSYILRCKIHPCLANPIEVDILDGLRMNFKNGSSVHLRQSGNAPELRVYVETANKYLTNELLDEIIKAIKFYLSRGIEYE